MIKSFFIQIFIVGLHHNQNGKIMMMSDVCLVCGAAIGENNTTGVGGGCMANIVIPAKRDCFKEVKSLELWIMKAKEVQRIYIEEYKNTKFRSEFKKSFYTSMCTAERISKKQLEIMRNQMSYNTGLDGFIDQTLRDLYFMMFDLFSPNQECPELYMEKLNMHKKLYLSGRKNADYVITKLPKNPKQDQVTNSDQESNNI